MNLRSQTTPTKPILERRTRVLRNTCLVIAVLALAAIVVALLWPVLMVTVNLGQRDG